MKGLWYAVMRDLTDQDWGYGSHDPEEAETEYFRVVEEERERRIEEYENSPETWAGWAQQDTIDMYRRER